MLVAEMASGRKRRQPAHTLATSSPAPSELLQPVIGLAPTNGHQTSRAAVRILLDKDLGYHEPTRRERDALLIGFAMMRRVLYGASFDVVRLTRDVDLLDPAAIAHEIDAIEICEIKSTNRPALGADLKGYFFNITAAEQLTAQALGGQYRFLFVNTITHEHQEMSLAEVFGRARAMYAATHIRF